MILNRTQAEKIYIAMRKLKAIDARLHVRIPVASAYIHVKEHTGGDIQVWFGDAIGHPVGSLEKYDSLNAFGLAYAL